MSVHTIPGNEIGSELGHFPLLWRRGLAFSGRPVPGDQLRFLLSRNKSPPSCTTGNAVLEGPTPPRLARLPTPRRCWHPPPTEQATRSADSAHWQSFSRTNGRVSQSPMRCASSPALRDRRGRAFHPEIVEGTLLVPGQNLGMEGRPRGSGGGRTLEHEGV
jgi:hypothetical protein